jgi:hypothetical protein
MLNTPQEPAKIIKARSVAIIFAILIPIILATSLWSEKSIDPHVKDFAAYWQASHMILSGQNVYDSQEWVTERSLLGTALYSEPTFQYPLPFAILMAPLGLLSLGHAYTLWLFIGDIAIFISIFLLFSFFPKRSMIFEILVIAFVFFFRPTYTVIFNGQILVEILLFITLSIFLFSEEKLFYGGLIASLTTLKPSFGAPFLILMVIWLMLTKRWKAIIGIMTGGIILCGLGMLNNSHWVADFLTIGNSSFNKYIGMQTTVWGLSGLIFKAGIWRVAAGFVGFFIVLALTGYFLLNKKNKDNPFLLISIFIPISLLITPYSWSYDQFLLIIPIFYILMTLSGNHGDKPAVLFSLSIIGFAIILFFIANILGHDVWSLLVSGIIWILMLLIFRFYPVASVKI